MAEQFFTKLIQRLKNVEKLGEIYWWGKRWTQCIKGLTEELLSVNTSREYYRVDSLEYCNTNANIKNLSENKITFDNFDGVYLNFHNWKNKTLVEYENKRHDWTDELVKLSHLRAELKVIIAYSEWCDSPDKYKRLIEQKLEVAIELLKGCQEESLKDNWLIVFGPCKVGKNFANEDIIKNFVGYKIEKGKFKEIIISNTDKFI